MQIFSYRVSIVIIGAALYCHHVDAAVLADPTRPDLNVQLKMNAQTTDALLPGQGAVQLTLQSVLLATDRQVAIINGQTLRKGDQIANMTLVEIRSNYVILRDSQGQTTRLQLYSAQDIKIEFQH